MSALRIDDALARLERTRRSGDGWVALCPAHEDRTASLSVAEGADGQAIFHCHAGCNWEEVQDALDPSATIRTGHRRVATPKPPKPAPQLPSEEDVRGWQERLSANRRMLERLGELRGWSKEAMTELGLGFDGERVTFPTRGSDGRLLGVQRYLPNAGTRNGCPKMLAAAGTKRGLFPAPETIPGDELWVVEGEPDAVAARSLGVPAVAFPGAGKGDSGWGLRIAAGRKRVVVVADCDAPGRAAAAELADSIAEFISDVRILDFSSARADGYDLGDALREYRSEGATTAQIVALVRKVAEDSERVEKREETEERGSDEGLSLLSSLSSTTPRWPQKLRNDALIGLVGEVVRTVEPHSEADPSAVAIALLVEFGNAVGRGPYILRGDTQHATNLFACVVGETGSGRKGTALAVLKRIMEVADPDWASRCVVSGLVSGEGVIHHVRDPRSERRRARKDEGSIADENGYVVEVVDHGVEDKRLLVVESEFARALNAIERKDNTLSPVLRELWDGGDARTLAKNSHDQATGALVSVVAQITPKELRDRLGSIELANGFANRFLYVCSERSKSLPHGGSTPDGDVSALGGSLREALRQSRIVERVDLDVSARGVWEAEYDRLTMPPPGLYGGIIARGGPIVLRIALLYMLLDLRAVISEVHLRAALEVWRYAEESARFLFGQKLGDPLADSLLEALRKAGGAGMTRTDIRSQVGNREGAERIDAALESLAGSRLAETAKEQTGGRPTERWWGAGARTGGVS